MIIYIRLVRILNIYIHKQHCMYWKKDLQWISGFYEIKMLHVSCTCICVYQWKKMKKMRNLIFFHILLTLTVLKRVFSHLKLREKNPDRFIIHIIWRTWTVIFFLNLRNEFSLIFEKDRIFLIECHVKLTFYCSLYHWVCYTSWRNYT